MTALVGQEVDATVSPVVRYWTGVPGLEAHEAGGQDLAELGQAFGGSEAVGMEGGHDQSPYRQLKMIPPELSTNKNQVISEDVR